MLPLCLCGLLLKRPVTCSCCWGLGLPLLAAALPPPLLLARHRQPWLVSKSPPHAHTLCLQRLRVYCAS